MVILGACPKCGSDFVENGEWYFCIKGGECSTIVNKKYFEANISQNDIKSVLGGGFSEEKVFHYEKDGVKKSMRGRLCFDSASGKFGIKFSERKILGICPKCRKNVVTSNGYYLCENYKAQENPCDFIIARNQWGASISESEMTNLLNGNETNEKTLVYKSGNKARSKLKLVDGRLSLVPICACPVCKKNVYDFGGSWGCEGRNTGSCDFSVSKNVKGATLSVKDLIAICQGSLTDPIIFTWREGKIGPARLCWMQTKLGFQFEEN